MTIAQRVNLWEARWRLLQLSPRLIRAHLRLLKVEVNFASSALPGMVASATVLFLCVIILLAVLAAGAVTGLANSGFSVPAATAIAAVFPLVVGGIAAGMAYARFEGMTLPESRKRIRALLELIDE